MKIGQEIRSKVEQVTPKRVQEGKKDFQQFIQTQTQHLEEKELKKLIDDITEQGKKIARFRSFKDFAKFKRMVKEFLQKTVYDGLSLHESRSFHVNSFNHKLTTVNEIDEKLVQLTEEVMDQEKKNVDLLGLIGEIEGLLINLYT